MITYRDDSEVEIGDVVKLVSGGPEMTVVGFCLDNKVACGWFPEEPHAIGILQTAYFEPETLEYQR